MLGNGEPTHKVYLTDRLTVTFHLQQPLGIADEEKTFSILYADVSTLPPPPPLMKNADTIEAKYVSIYADGRYVVFVYMDTKPSSGEYSEETITGPYYSERSLA